MKIDIEKTDGLKKELLITIPVEEINKAVDEKLASIASKVKIDGFRPGKVPMPIIKQRYADSAFREVIDELMKKSSTEVFTKHKLRPAIQPQFDIVTLEKGKDFSYRISLEELPTIPEVKFDDIKLEKWIVDVNEEAIKESIQRAADNMENLEPIKTDRTIKEGDTVEFDFEGSVDGVVHDSMVAKNYQLKIGSGNFIPGFEDAMIGLKKGEEKDLKLKFPEEYHAKEFAGKDVIFKVKIHDILEKKPMKIDDEMAKKAGFKDLVDMKKVAKAHLEKEYEDLGKTALKIDLFDLLDKEIKIDLPPTLLANEFDALWKNYEQEMEKMEKKPTKAEQEKKRKEYEKMANRRVKLALTLSEMGQKLNVQITEDDVRQSFMAEFKKYPGQEQIFMEMLQKNPQMAENVRAQLYEGKVVDTILDKLKLANKKVSKDELLKKLEA